jgi:hypothetical protein
MSGRPTWRPLHAQQTHSAARFCDLRLRPRQIGARNTTTDPLPLPKVCCQSDCAELHRPGRRGLHHRPQLVDVLRAGGWTNRRSFIVARNLRGEKHLRAQANVRCAQRTPPPAQGTPKADLADVTAEVALTSAPKRALRRGRRPVFSWRAVQNSECCSYPAGGWATAP